MDRYRAESPLQKSERHLREVEEQTSDLAAFIERMQSDGYPRRQLEQLLTSFEQSLTLARQRVDLERRVASTWRALILWRHSR